MLWSFSQEFRQYLSHIHSLSYSTYLLCNNYMQVTILGVKDSSQTKIFAPGAYTGFDVMAYVAYTCLFLQWVALYRLYQLLINALRWTDKKIFIFNKETLFILARGSKQVILPSGILGNMGQHFWLPQLVHYSHLEMLLNLLQCTGQPPEQKIIQSKMSAMPRQRNPAIG